MQLRVEDNTQLMQANVQELSVAKQNTGDAMLQMIEKVCTNPDFDIAKMEKLIAMRDAEMARVAKIDFTTAFAAMQPQLPAVEKTGSVSYDKNATVAFRFAKLENIVEAISPLLKEYGFSFSHCSHYTDKGVKIITTLMHSGGHSIGTEREAPLDTSGSKNQLQAGGSTTSYLKRYNLCDLLGIVTKDEDKDGNNFMDSEEFVLIKNSVTNAKTKELFEMARESARQNKHRMGKDQQKEISVEIEKVRQKFMGGNGNV